MKYSNSFIVLTVLAAGLLFSACTQEELAECRQVSLSFPEVAVKTTLKPDHSALQWSEGDAISVYNDYNGSIAGATYQAGGNISVSVPVDAKWVKATCPETAGTYADPGFVFPRKQTQATAGALNGEYYPIVAEAQIINDAAALHFESVGSAFALNVYNPKEQGEEFRSISVQPSGMEQAVQVSLETPFAIDTDKPADKRGYAKQVYACLEKGQYSQIAFVVRTNKYQYSITSNETVLDLESHDFFVLNLDLANMKVYATFDTGCEGFSLEEEDVTLTVSGFIELIHEVPDEQLTTDEIPDFSTVGYHWGEDEFPDYNNVVQLDAPSGGDDTQMIQNAIDNASEGTVILFRQGRYIVDDLLVLDKNGIILRGSGNRQTEIFARGTLTLDEVDPTANNAYYPVVRPLINIGITKSKSTRIKTNVLALRISTIGVNNKAGRQIEYHLDAWNVRGRALNSSSVETMGAGPAIVDSAFCGSRFVTVDDASSFNVGDNVVVWRPGTQPWIHALKMDMIIKALDDQGTINQWDPANFTMCWERTVKAVVANRVYLDTPLVMSITQPFGGGELRHYKRTRIKECGIENLLLVSDYNPDRDSDAYGDRGDIYHATSAIVFHGAEHCWVKNVETRRFSMSAVSISEEARNISVVDCDQKEPTGYLTGGLRYAFHISGGQQCLVRNCTSDGDRHQFATGAQIPGPNVFSRCTGTNALSDVGPHQRWATGTLYDNVSTNNSMKAYDAGNSGTGHGWQGTNQIFWCCTAAKFSVQTPWVTGKNYAIGCKYPGGGAATLTPGREYPNPGYGPDGSLVYDSVVNGTRIDGECRPLQPGEEESLYESQLNKRLAAGDKVSNYVQL